METQSLLAEAVAHHREGRWNEAAQLYARVLSADVRSADAWHLCGVLAHQVGRHDEAASHIGRAISLSPQVADFHLNLAAARLAQGNAKDAESSCHRALALQSNNAAAWTRLGSALSRQSRLDEAIEAYERAIELAPNDAVAHCNLGESLFASGKLPEAERTLRRALELQPDAHASWTNLGCVLRAAGKLNAAVETLETAKRLAPESGSTLVSLGNAYRAAGRFADSLECFKRALSIEPRHANAWNCLGAMQQDAGDHDEALECFRRAADLRPGDFGIASNLLFALNLSDRLSRAEVFAEHCRWGCDVRRQVGERWRPSLARDAEANAVRDDMRKRPSIAPPKSCSEIPSSLDAAAWDRPLRIGYLSPDFRAHPTMSFVEPLIRLHDRRCFEVFCYAEIAGPDDVSRRIEAASDGWRRTCGWSGKRLAQQIRDDRVDVLVDLAGHTAGNRMDALAVGAAPVQVSMLGYLNTTGLDSVDWVITDAMRDPPGSDVWYVERLCRLPGGGFCWRPPEPSPDVSGGPSRDGRGSVTFGSTHRLDKLTAATCELWARTLRDIPDSRLFIFRSSLADNPALCDAIRKRFTSLGISDDRIDIVGRLENSVDAVDNGYLHAYDRMDVLLDAVPWSAGTTACESLWMGVPVVTWGTDRPIGRAAASILHRVGLDDLIADSADQFVAIAAELAADAPRRAALRSNLRDMARRHLADWPRFVRELEDAYRMMWNEEEVRAGMISPTRNATTRLPGAAMV